MHSFTEDIFSLSWRRMREVPTVDPSGCQRSTTPCPPRIRGTRYCFQVLAPSWVVGARLGILPPAGFRATELDCRVASTSSRARLRRATGSLWLGCPVGGAVSRPQTRDHSNTSCAPRSPHALHPPGPARLRRHPPVGVVPAPVGRACQPQLHRCPEEPAEECTKFPLTDLDWKARAIRCVVLGSRRLRCTVDREPG